EKPPVGIGANMHHLFWSILSAMRRIWATLLMAVFSFPLIGPDALSARADQKLPRCCRSNAKHHCTIALSQPASSRPALEAGRCSLFRADPAMPPLPPAAIVKLSPATFGAVASHATARPQNQPHARIASDRSCQKRGPPSLS